MWASTPDQTPIAAQAPEDRQAPHEAGERARVVSESQQARMLSLYALTQRKQPGRPSDLARLRYIAAGEASAHLHLTLHGAIDLAADELLADTLDKVRAAPPCDITVDLSAVTFLCSAGLSLLAELNSHATASGHALTVMNPTPIVRRALHICGFDQVLTITGG